MGPIAKTARRLAEIVRKQQFAMQSQGYARKDVRVDGCLITATHVSNKTLDHL